MYHDICKEAPKCIRGARNVMIFTIMLALGLSISYYSDLTPLGVDNEFLSTLYAQTAGSAIGVCILFIPTYFYLKKRFYSPGSVSEVMIKPRRQSQSSSLASSTRSSLTGSLQNTCQKQSIRIPVIQSATNLNGQSIKMGFPQNIRKLLPRLRPRQSQPPNSSPKLDGVQTFGQISSS